jgi:hypothetical protein
MAGRGHRGGIDKRRRGRRVAWYLRYQFPLVDEHDVGADLIEEVAVV